MDIFDYWMERRKARASNSWRDTEVHAVNVQRINIQRIVDIIEDTIQKYFGRRINQSTLSQIQFDLVAKGLDRGMAQRVIEAIRDAPPADWDLEALAEALADDYDGDMTPTRFAAFRRREPVITPTFETRTSLANWDLEVFAHDYDGDTISAVSYCPRIMTSEKGPVR